MSRPALPYGADPQKSTVWVRHLKSGDSSCTNVLLSIRNGLECLDNCYNMGLTLPNQASIGCNRTTLHPNVVDGFWSVCTWCQNERKAASYRLAGTSIAQGVSPCTESQNESVCVKLVIIRLTQNNFWIIASQTSDYQDFGNTETDA